MEDDFVDPAVAGERFQRLRVVIERSALAKNRAREGRVEEVLVEGPSKKRPDLVTGRTRQNRLVHFTPPRPIRAGSYATVEITRGAPHHLEDGWSTSSPSPPTSHGSRRCAVTRSVPASSPPATTIGGPVAHVAERLGC